MAGVGGVVVGKWRQLYLNKKKSLKNSRIKAFYIEKKYIIKDFPVLAGKHSKTK